MLATGQLSRICRPRLFSRFAVSTSTGLDRASRVRSCASLASANSAPRNSAASPSASRNITRPPRRSSALIRSILVKANDHITIAAGEQLGLAGGKICVTSADTITLNAKGFLRLLYADIQQGSPLSGALSAFLPGPVANLISDIAETCK